MMINKFLKQFSGTRVQVCAALCGTLISLSDGMQYGWTAPTIPVLLSESSPFKVTESQIEWLETLWMLGAFFGLPLNVMLVDKIGRKKTILVAAALEIAGWLLMAMVTSVEWLCVGRTVGGIAGDMTIVAAPMYIAEIAEQNIRGFLSSLIFIMMLTGVLLIYCIAPFVPIWMPCVVGVCISLICVVLFSFQPESPYYYVYCDKLEEASTSLKRLRQRNDVEEELQDIKLALERQKAERGSVWDLFLVPSNRKATIITSVLNLSQHFCCISVFLMNLHLILEEAGSFYLSASVEGIIFAIVMLFAAISASLVMDKFGRKFLLSTSAFVSGLCLLLLAIYFTMKNNGYDISSVTWVPLVLVMVYALAFKMGVGLVPIVLTAELFPAKTKAYGMTLSDLSYVVSSTISIELYHALKHKMGIDAPFYLFALFAFMTVFFTWLYIPETKGKTLEEIQQILKNNGSDQKELDETVT